MFCYFENLQLYAEADVHAYVTYEFQKYYNRNERNWNNGKCDTFSSCNYYFILCGNKLTINDACAYGSLTTKIWDSGETLTFTNGQTLTDSGLTNPYQGTINEKYQVRTS